jgi:hypothetical protein
MARSGSSDGGGGYANDYLFSSATRQVSPGMAGLVAMGEKEDVGNKDGWRPNGGFTQVRHCATEQQQQ